jgi:hypothetical protein
LDLAPAALLQASTMESMAPIVIETLLRSSGAPPPA